MLQPVSSDMDTQAVSRRKPSSIAGSGLVKRFEGQGQSSLAVGPVDLHIRPGEFVSIVGPSGCGKSTLMLMVAGLLKASRGEVKVDGAALERPLTDVGIVFQDDLLLEFRTAEDNILLQTDIRGVPRKIARVQARRLLQALGVGHAGQRYPKQLSGGMRQRVSLARALIHEPSLLLMDEAFGALDAITRTQMRHDLETLWLERQCTVLFITHSIEEAVGLSDRVIVMSPSPGKIMEEFQIDLPRPRPLEYGKEPVFVEYVDKIHDVLRRLGVFKD